MEMMKEDLLDELRNSPESPYHDYHHEHPHDHSSMDAYG
jgi:hypothetical protein